MKTLARWAWRRAVIRTVVGRYRDRDRPREGRLTGQDVLLFLNAGARIFDSLLPQERLKQYQTPGNRLNVVMAALSIAQCRAFVAAGIEKEHALELTADTVWRAGESLFKPLFVLIRLSVRDPRMQMNAFLRMAMRFPFSQPASGPGYRRVFWAEPDRFCMDLSQCAQYDFVKEYGEPADVEVFRRVWCMYDFAAAQARSPRADDMSACTPFPRATAYATCGGTLETVLDSTHPVLRGRKFSVASSPSNHQRKFIA